jgi:prophage maintenance system killer protein
MILRYGGKFGVWDHGLLASALARPKMTAGGKFVRRTVFEKAPASGSHLRANHPFV